MNKLKSVFSLKVGGSDYVSDIVSFELTSDEANSDSQTFNEYNLGVNRQWKLSITAIFDGGSLGSFHDLLWTNSGTTTEFLIQPLSGIASESKPKYKGQVRIPFKPDLVIEAGSDSTFDYDLELVGQPLKVTNGEVEGIFSNVYNSFY